MGLSYLVWFVFANFPSVYVIDKYGLKIGLIVGISLTTLGFWIRSFINKNFIFCMLGQTFMALGQPFMYNAPAKVTSNWFPKNEAALATTIGAQANVFGVLVSFILPVAMTSDFEADKTYTQEELDNYKS